MQFIFCLIVHCFAFSTMGAGAYSITQQLNHYITQDIAIVMKYTVNVVEVGTYELGNETRWWKYPDINGTSKDIINYYILDGKSSFPTRFHGG